MNAKNNIPGGSGPAGPPAAGGAQRLGRAALLVLGLTATGACLPLLLQPRETQPWLASVTLSVRDPVGNPLPDTLQQSLSDARTDEALGRAVDLLGLDRDPEFAGTEVNWLTVAHEIVSGAEDGATDPRHRAIRALALKTAVRHKPGDAEARLLVTASSQDKAIRIAEALATVYSAATEITGAVPEQAAMAEAEKAEAALAEFRNAPANAGLTDVLLKRSRLKGLDAHRAEMLLAIRPEADLSDATVNDVISGRLGAAIEDPQLTALGKAYTEASMQRSALAVSLGPKHPRLQQADAELQKARDALQARLKLLKAESGDQARNREKMLASLDEKRQQLSQEIAGSGIDLDRYDALVAALDKARDAARAPAATESAKLPIYDASAPDVLQPVKAALSTWQILMGGLSGLGAGLAFVLARRSHGRRAPAAKPERPQAPPRREPPPAERPAPRRADSLESTKPLHRHHAAANAEILPQPVQPPPQPKPRLKHASPEPAPIPTVEKLRRVAPHLFEADRSEREVERLREELADLRRRVLVSAGHRI